MIINAEITPTKVACATETNGTGLALQDLIVQLIDKNMTLLMGAAVYHPISVSAILQKARTPIR